MRKVIVNTFLSLDGVMQAPGGAGEDPSGGFELEGWSVNYWDDAMGQRMGDLMSPPFDLLLGRKTLWGCKTSDVFRRLARRRGVVRSTPGAIEQCPSSDAP